ncbi:MAG: hypothetical protein RR846_08835 [Oscillospiraceae bacterium]
MSQEMITLYGTILTVLMGIVGYFLKSTMSRTEEHGKDIQRIKQTYVEKKDFETRTEKLTQDVSDIKENFLTKEDFYRSQSNVDKKLDKMYDLLLELKGAPHNG